MENLKYGACLAAAASLCVHERNLQLKLTVNQVRRCPEVRNGTMTKIDDVRQFDGRLGGTREEEAEEQRGGRFRFQSRNSDIKIRDK